MHGFYWCGILLMWWQSYCPPVGLDKRMCVHVVHLAQSGHDTSRRAFIALCRPGHDAPVDVLAGVLEAAKSACPSGIPVDPTCPPASSVASTLCNLLSIAGAISQSAGTGIYIGEGLPPVPPKLAKNMPLGLRAHVRVPHRIWGYAIVFKARGSIKCPTSLLSLIKEGDRPGILDLGFCHLSGGLSRIKFGGSS